MSNHNLSTYFHSSLYSFSEQAREQILQDFIRTVRDVSVKCCYDVDNDSFEIRCPSLAGLNANEVLSRIIKQRIDDYEDAADKGEEREDLVRFPESRFDALDNVVESDTAPTKPRSSEPRPVARTHIIMSNVDLLKVFRLHDLDEFGLLERVLVSATEKMESIFGSSVTCRAARFDPEDGHVFNGRTGKHQHLTNGDTAKLETLQLPAFGTLNDDRMLADEADDGAVGDHWELDPADQEIGVSKWLAGVGQTVSVRALDPLVEKVDMPKDTKQMLAREQTHAISRARVAKGANVISSDTEASDEDSDGEEPTAGDFSQFLASNRSILPDQQNGQDEEEDPDQIGSEASDKTKTGPSFASLLPSGAVAAKKRRDSGDWNAVAKKSAPDGRPQVYGQPSSQSTIIPQPNPETSPSRTVLSRNAPSQLEDDWVDYGGTYAKRDNIGLKGNAERIAKWELQNYSLDQGLSKQNPRAGPVAIRSAVPSQSSKVFSNSGQTSASARSTSASFSEVSSVAPPKTIRRYEDWDPSEAEWRNVPSATTTSGGNPRLIDDQALPSSTPTKIPPGYSRQKSATEARTSDPSAAKDLTSFKTDIMDGEAENMRPSMTRPASRSSNIPTLAEAEVQGSYTSTAALRKANR